MIENLLLDGAMLVLTLFLMRKRIYYGRVVMAATLGAVVSTFMLIIGLQYGVFYIVMLFVTGVLMLVLSMKQKRWNELMQGVVYYFALVFSFTKLHQVSEWLIGSRVNGIIPVLLVIGIMGVVLLYMTYQNGRKKQKPIYYVELMEQGKSVKLKALLDTGNALREPFSGKPVSIVESSVWHNIVEECALEKFKVIPFRSIGQEHGMLQGTEIEKMIIRQDDREIVQKNAIIAFYEGELSNDKSYQMILHQNLLL